MRAHTHAHTHTRTHTQHLVDLDFEARKDAAQVFGATVRIKDAEEKAPGAAYVLQRPYILNMLFQG